jgi:hypothetical protein
VQNLNVGLYDIERKRILKRRAVVGADIVVPSALGATGTLSTDEKADFVDGQTFTLNDGTQAATVFEIDTTGGGVTPGNVQVDISGDVSKDDVRDTIIAAINGVVATLLITASSGGAATVNLVNANPGTGGNVAITHNITAPEWSASGMSGGSGDVVILGAGELPGTAIAAIGGSSRTGTVVAYEVLFGKAALTEVGGADDLTPKNLCKIADAATGEPIVDGLGNEVHALLQYENNTDGTAITASTPNRAQLSFVVHNPTNDDLVLCDPQYIGGQTIDYSPVERYAFKDIPEHAWLGDDFVDAGAAAATRQAGYDNQGVIPVNLTTNAILDIEAAGKYWEVRDDAEATLFRITEGSLTSATEVALEDDVDTFRVDALVNDFDRGIKARTGGTRPIDIGVQDGIIETTAGALEVQAKTVLSLDDGYKPVGWSLAEGIHLADSAAEWTNFEAEFGGEVSLLNAIVQAKQSTERATAWANVIVADIPADTLIKGDAVANISAVLPSYKGLSFITDVEIFINGTKQRPGATALSNNDVYPSAVAAEQALGNFYAEFVLRFRGGNNPDNINMVVWGQPTP